MCILIAPVRDTWSHVTARVVSRVNIVTVVEYVRWFLNWRGSWYRKIFIVVRSSGGNGSILFVFSLIVAVVFPLFGRGQLGTIVDVPCLLDGVCYHGDVGG
jgi:hypothetical protein